MTDYARALLREAGHECSTIVAAQHAAVGRLISAASTMQRN